MVPKRRRSDIRAARVVREPAPVITIEPVDVSWNVAEKLRFWCPMCGMVADLSMLDNSPYEVRLKLQRFGGKVRRADGRVVGYMEYVPVDGEAYGRLVARLAEIARVLPSHLESEAKKEVYRPPATFADWVAEVEKRYPEVAKDERAAVLYALSSALSEIAGVTVKPGELQSMFGGALAAITRTSTFDDVAATVHGALAHMAATMPQLRILNRMILATVVNDLVNFDVESQLEVSLADEIKRLGLRKGTKKYEKFFRDNARKIVLEHMREFERALEDRLAAWGREKKQWFAEVEAANAYADELERVLDIVTGVYTLAGRRLPPELVSAVGDAASSLRREAESAKEVLRKAEAEARRRKFTEYMEVCKHPLIKEAWRYQ